MRGRPPVLLLSTLAMPPICAALVACSSSSSSSASDAGRPVKDANVSHEAGLSKDGGTTSDAKRAVEASARHDAGVSDAGVSDAGVSDADIDAPFAITDADIVACTASSTASCSLYQGCNPAGFPGAFGDAGNCISRSTISCLANLAAVSAGNPVHTAACAAVLATEPCTNYLDNDNTLDACAPSGSLEAGSTCLTNGACASDFCSVAPASACGVCAAPPSAGTSCVDLTSCGFGRQCYKGKCVAPTTTVGGPCSTTQSCGAGLSCVMAKDAGAGACEAAATTVGASCDPTLETAAGCSSIEGLTCVSDKTSAAYKTCQPYGTARPGEPCGAVLGIAIQCQDVSECFSMGDAGRRCVPRAADDAGCNTVSGPSCAAPARCIGTPIDGGTTGVCRIPNLAACR
jgi:hypothetical protein